MACTIDASTRSKKEGWALYSDAWGSGSVMEIQPDEIVEFHTGSYSNVKCNESSQKVTSEPHYEESEHAKPDKASSQPSRDEMLEYLDRHRLRSFLTEVAMYVANHFPPDPFDFLLEHFPALVMHHREAHDLDNAHSPPVSKFSPVQVAAEKRKQVVRHLAAALQTDAITRASSSKLFDEVADASGHETGSLTEEAFKMLLRRLTAAWGLQSEDIDIMATDLRRWRFRANAAKGTRGFPLWPLEKSDFMEAFPSLLRSVRDRYVPIGGRLQRSLFVRRCSGIISSKYDPGPSLGRGSYGEVHLVTMKGTRLKRVCKQVDKRFQKVPDEELVGEVDLLRALDHPHIIRVFEFFEDETYFQMIMEPIFGGTLTQLVLGLHRTPEGVATGARPETLTESWVATLFNQLMSALSYAHDVAGLIHKDLKTDNVLMVGRPDLTPTQRLNDPVHAMLADFGIAEVFSATAPLVAHECPSDDAASNSSIAGMRGRSHRVGGTPSYMSPEMYKGSFTEKSDMWSIGVMLFQILTGDLPYKGKNIYVLGCMICNPRVHPPWETLTKLRWGNGVRLFCKQLLTKEETMRPSASEALKDPWLARASALHDATLSAAKIDRDGLHTPHLHSHLMKVARTCITSQLNLSQLYQMNTRFKLYDVSGDGMLNYAELRHALEDVGVTASEQVELIIESLDTNHNGFIEYSEFVAGCIDLSCEDIRDHLRVAFAVFDLDGSGAITLEELRLVLTQGPNAQLHSQPGPTGTASENSLSSILPDGKTVEDLFFEMDADGEGSIEFDEFEKHLLEEHEKAGLIKGKTQSRAMKHRGRRFALRPDYHTIPKPPQNWFVIISSCWTRRKYITALGLESAVATLMKVNACCTSLKN